MKVWWYAFRSRLLGENAPFCCGYCYAMCRLVGDGRVDAWRTGRRCQRLRTWPEDLQVREMPR